LSRSATHWHARKRRLVRAHNGIYLVGAEPELLDRVRAALRVCPPGTVVGFQTAAALLGFGVPESDDIHVVVPAGSPIPHRRGVRTHESVVPLEPCRRLSVPCTPSARTAIDLARTLDRPTGLAVLDAALFARACTPAELATEVLVQAALRGVRQARELVPLADQRAECKQESHLRLILHDGGIRGFEPQLELYDPERASLYPDFRLDLAHRALRVAAEYDGQSHTRGRLRADRRRHNRLSDLGWRMRYFTDHELYWRPEAIVSTVRRAMAEAAQDPRDHGGMHAIW
jgi:very-short-patch-repair endonuclease